MRAARASAGSTCVLDFRPRAAVFYAARPAASDSGEQAMNMESFKIIYGDAWEDAYYDAVSSSMQEFRDLCEQELWRVWETTTREGRIYARAVDEHPHLTQLIEKLETLGLDYIYNNIDDYMREKEERRLSQQDPYGYYGVSQNDFY